MATAELYNLRWNSYYANLTNVFINHRSQESLVDVSISCEGQFIKAHRLVLSASSVYFQKVFETHTAPHLLIVLNDVKYKDLELVVEFMYKGEVKVADSDMPSFLALGKMLQVKGLCSVALEDKLQKTNDNVKITEEKTEKAPEPIQPTSLPAKSDSRTLPIRHDIVATSINKNKKILIVKKPKNDKEDPKTTSEVPANKKRKMSPPPVPPPSTEPIKTLPVSTTTPQPPKSPFIPRPPNAFMIFANQWRKKLAVEYPEASNKDISVKLGNMWKSLSRETKDGFYDDACKAEEEHKRKYPNYNKESKPKGIITPKKTSDLQGDSVINIIDLNDDSNDKFTLPCPVKLKNLE